VHDRLFKPLTLALFPEEELPPLDETLGLRGLTTRQRRMLRLAAAPLRQALESLPTGAVPPPLFLGLPQGRSEQVEAGELIPCLAIQSKARFDEKSSQVFPRGRAAGIFAMEAAAAYLAKGKAERVLVGGVDTYLDLALLAELDREERVLRSEVRDGFIPGEGAAFVLLKSAGSRAALGASQNVRVLGIGTAADTGHLYSDKPAKGEGLALAMENLFRTVPRSPGPVATVYAGFNGESFWAKEWGVAQIRHSDRIATSAGMEHPADCHGDLGAATAPMLLALAGASLSAGMRASPALVVASSDREDRGCALIDLLP
jgi:3-oxoacyl-[acyl-carrier-protein] synthase-1